MMETSVASSSRMEESLEITLSVPETPSGDLSIDYCDSRTEDHAQEMNESIGGEEEDNNNNNNGVDKNNNVLEQNDDDDHISHGEDEDGSNNNNGFGGFLQLRRMIGLLCHITLVLAWGEVAVHVFLRPIFYQGNQQQQDEENNINYNDDDNNNNNHEQRVDRSSSELTMAVHTALWLNFLPIVGNVLLLFVFRGNNNGGGNRSNINNNNMNHRNKNYHRIGTTTTTTTTVMHNFLLAVIRIGVQLFLTPLLFLKSNNNNDDRTSGGWILLAYVWTVAFWFMVNFWHFLHCIWKDIMALGLVVVVPPPGHEKNHVTTTTTTKTIGSSCTTTTTKEAEDWVVVGRNFVTLGAAIGEMTMLACAAWTATRPLELWIALLGWPLAFYSHIFQQCLHDLERFRKQWRYSSSWQKEEEEEIATTTTTTASLWRLLQPWQAWRRCDLTEKDSKNNMTNSDNNKNNHTIKKVEIVVENKYFIIDNDDDDEVSSPWEQHLERIYLLCCNGVLMMAWARVALVLGLHMLIKDNDGGGGVGLGIWNSSYHNSAPITTTEQQQADKNLNLFTQYDDIMSVEDKIKNDMITAASNVTATTTMFGQEEEDDHHHHWCPSQLTPVLETALACSLLLEVLNAIISWTRTTSAAPFSTKTNKKKENNKSNSSRTKTRTTKKKAPLLQVLLLLAAVRMGIEHWVTPLLGEDSCIAMTHLWTVACWSIGDTLRFTCFVWTDLSELLLSVDQYHQGRGSSSLSSISSFLSFWLPWLRYTILEPVIFPLGVLGEWFLLVQAALIAPRPFELWLAVVLWPTLGFVPLWIQLWKQRTNFVQQRSSPTSRRRRRSSSRSRYRRSPNNKSLRNHPYRTSGTDTPRTRQLKVANGTTTATRTPKKRRTLFGTPSTLGGDGESMESINTRTPTSSPFDESMLVIQEEEEHNNNYYYYETTTTTPEISLLRHRQRPIETTTPTITPSMTTTPRSTTSNSTPNTTTIRHRRRRCLEDDDDEEEEEEEKSSPLSTLRSVGLSPIIHNNNNYNNNDNQSQSTSEEDKQQQPQQSRRRQQQQQHQHHPLGQLVRTLGIGNEEEETILTQETGLGSSTSVRSNSCRRIGGDRCHSKTQ